MMTAETDGASPPESWRQAGVLLKFFRALVSALVSASVRSVSHAAVLVGPRRLFGRRSPGFNDYLTGAFYKNRAGAVYW